MLSVLNFTHRFCGRPIFHREVWSAIMGGRLCITTVVFMVEKRSPGTYLYIDIFVFFNMLSAPFNTRRLL